MTVEPAQQGSNLPAQQEFGATGLEDFGVGDAVIPRIKIVQAEGLWQDTLSGEKFQTLRFIILGMTKQRILWHQVVDDGDAPMCKSPEFNTGYPNLEQGGKKAFPWQLAGFDPNDFPEDPATGSKPLPCASCQLKEWNTHPSGSGTPYCAEQWSLSILYDAGNDSWQPAILTLQKSNIKPIKSYLTAFARSNQPAFTAICTGTLKVQSRGTVDYSVATFTKEGPSDSANWMEYADQFVQMRDYLTRPPRPSEDAQAAQAQQPAPQQVQSVQVQEPPAQQAPPSQPAPTQAPPVQQAPVEQAPPPVQQQAPAPPAPQPAAPPAQTPPAAANNDLPF